MKNNVILFFIFTTFYSALLSANAIQSDDAWSIIKPQECRFSGEFTQQKKLQGLEQAIISSGVFFYDCELGIIWKTLSPNTESLVLNKTSDSYRVKRLKIEKIQSAQDTFVSQLIMALVSADEDYLSKTFKPSSVDQTTTVLTPTNRRLKRAIKSITLTDSGVDQITFDMLDQNNQTTSIISTALKSYSNNLTQADCKEIEEITEIECGLLKDKTAQ